MFKKIGGLSSKCLFEHIVTLQKHITMEANFLRSIFFSLPFHTKSTKIAGVV